MSRGNPVMSFEEKQRALRIVKPESEWVETRPSTVGLQPTVAWEEKLGDLDEWRTHEEYGRKILPLLFSAEKSESLSNSVQSRLRRLYPNESWIAWVGEDGIYLKCNGQRRTRAERHTGEAHQARQRAAAAAATDDERKFIAV